MAAVVRWTFWLAVSSVLVLQSAAQDQDAGREAVRTRLQVTSRLVQVNVLVHDSRGAVARDLSREDFTLLDEGRPRKIALFWTAGESAAATGPAPLHPLAIDNRRTFNRLPATATILLVDSLNMPQPEDLLYVRRELPKFLKQLQPGDAIAIYALAGPAVRVLHEFSDSTESLIQAAEHARGAVGQWLRSADVSQGMAEGHVRIEWTIAALESIALHVAGRTRPQEPGLGLRRVPPDTWF